ncbi:MAG: TRAP transporter substrate-binding protein [Clostridia bacterium]|nr:TRAP transporter substrate-binding protein [Clostridia bacterium]
MKKLVSLMMAAAMMLSFVACSTSAPAAAQPAAATEPAAAEPATAVDPAEVMTISVTNVLADDSPENTALQNFKKEIEEKSNGRMKVDIYANGIMGGEMENVENVRNNNVTMTMAASSVLANFVPECELFDLPYAFPTVEVGTKALNDPDVMDVLNTAFAKAGLHFVGANTADYRWLTCKKEVNSLADLKGMKVRVMENQNHVALWTALGANPTPMAGGGQLYTSLQQGTVDAQENPVAQINNNKFYEVQTYFVDTRHIMNVSGWIVSTEWYDGLSEDDRAIFDTAAANFLNEAYTLGTERLESDKAACEAGGMTCLPLSDAIRAEFKAAVGDTVEKKIRADIGDELVDALLACVAKYQ